MTGDKDGEQPRKVLGAGAVLLLISLALVGTGGLDASPGTKTAEAEAGGYVLLLALVLLVFGIHSFGRLGPLSAMEGPPPEPQTPGRGPPLRSKRT